MKPTASNSYFKLVGHWDIKKMIERSRKVEGTSTLKVEDGILKTKSGSINERAYIYEKIYVPTGGWIEIEFLAKSVSGVGNATVDTYDDPSFDSDSASDGRNIVDRNWKPYRLSGTAENGLNYVRILLGQWRSSVGETWFKNITIKGYNLNPQPDIRFAAIKGSKSKWNLDDATGSYANEGVIAATYKTTYIEVEHAPFRTWSKPVYSATVLRDGNPTNIMATIGTNPTTSDRICRIYLVNPATGSRIDPADIADDVTIFFEAKSR